MANEFLSVKNYFASRQILLSDEWLESCIQWCKEEDLSHNYTLKDLQLKIYEQWLLLDLREVEIRSLPANLCLETKYVINGNYSLQVMEVLDISRPKHWQLQKIRSDATFTRNNWQESEAIGTGKRVLQLILTDGIQEVKAMEYRPIPCIHVNLTPGAKVRLMGPVTLRRGVIMLEPQNIKVLGGEVDDIAVSHAAENILARMLNLPLNPQPNGVTEQMDIDIDETLESTATQAINNSSRQVVPQAILRGNNMGNNMNRNTYNTSNIGGNSFNKPSDNQLGNQNVNKRLQVNAFHSDNNPEEMEELRIREEIELLLEAEADLALPKSKVPKSVTIPNNRSTSPDLFEDDIDLDACNFEEIEKASSIKESPTKVKPVVAVNEIINLSDSLDDDGDDILAAIDVDAHLEKVDKKSDNKACSSPVNKGMNISKLLKNKLYISKGIFKIRAKFKTVVEKLTTTNDEYKMIIKIEDDSGEMDVKVHTDIVTDFAGYCAQALLSLKDRIMQKDEAAKQTVLQAISRVKEKLLQLDNLLEIQISKDEPLPIIVKVI